MDPVLTASGVGLGAFLIGFLIGYVFTRKGKILRIDWRLSIHSEETVDQEKRIDRGCSTRTDNDEDAPTG